MLIHSTVTSLSADVDECSMQPKTNTTQTIPTPQTSDSISSDSWVNISDKSNDDTFSSKAQSSKKRSQFSLFFQYFLNAILIFNF